MTTQHYQTWSFIIIIMAFRHLWKELAKDAEFRPNDCRILFFEWAISILTSILFFICSGICSREGPRDKCFGSSGGGGEKWPGPGPILLSGDSGYPLVGGGRRLVLEWPPCISIIHRNRVFFGRLIKRNIGKYLMNTTLIQLGIEWVLGPLKFQLMMITVTRILTVFIIKVNKRYFAIRGSTSEVGGRIFETNRRNTTRESKILIPSVTFSPASAGK